MTDNRLQPSDYSELKEFLEGRSAIDEIALNRRGAFLGGDGDLYIWFTVQLAGFDMWELHDEFDVDVVFCWHTPVSDRLRMGLRLR